MGKCAEEQAQRAALEAEQSDQRNRMEANLGFRGFRV